MAKTVVGMFDSIDQAQNVVQELIDNGFDSDDISLVASDSKGRLGGAERAAGASGSEAAEGAGFGAVGGTVLGGALGLLAGLGALAIPGIGPVIAAGPLSAAIGSATAAVGMAAAGAGIGAAAGGLVGGLVGAGIPEEDANIYAEGIRRGSTLVMANTSDDMANAAVNIMNRNGAVDVDDRGDFYRNSGWTGFRSDEEPYSGEHTADWHTRNRSGESFGDEWQDSSKAGTASGTVAGAATGAAAGAAGGPVGMAVGGIAGAAAGAGVGAAGDVAGEKAEDSSSTDADTTRRTTTGDATVGVGGADLGTNASRSTTASTGRSEADIASARSDVSRRTSEGETVLPIVEEELRVGKRQVQGRGVRAYTRLEETPVEENVTLRQEKINVERRPANRPASEADLNAFQEASIEMTETVEEPVVDKQARVVEEVVLGKDVQERQETIHDTVRRTDVNIEETGATQAVGSTMRGFETFDNDFRTYYQSNLGNSGYTYDQYSPVFRYGYDLANDPRYQSDWGTAEPDARRYWEERNPGTWDRFKDSVRYAWERVRGRA